MSRAGSIVRRVLHSELPVPRPVRPIIRGLYRLGVVMSELGRLVYKWLIVAPVMRSIATVDRNLRIEQIPYIRGPGQITIGRDVYISGKIDISFSRHGDDAPELVIGDHTFIGHGCCFAAARAIRIGNNCLVAGGVRIQDNDGHPLDPERRHRGDPVDEANIRPVTIGNGAWVAAGATVLKGVTIGKNAVVGARAVVVKDVPAGAIVAGNPAREIRRAEG